VQRAHVDGKPVHQLLGSVDDDRWAPLADQRRERVAHLRVTQQVAVDVVGVLVLVGDRDAY
jgi:hypothetical protein